MISQRDEDLLHWYFETGMGCLSSSPMGACLEQQAALAFDTRGHRIGKAAPWTAEAALAFRHRPKESRYQPDEDMLLRAISVSRRLQRLSEEDARSRAALE